jgi:magnesium-transporting ATPase (P-type)
MANSLNRLTNKSSVIVLEEFITGEQDYKQKNVIVNCETPLNNVLYAKSDVIHGEGIAIVCAVGSYTQASLYATGAYEVPMKVKYEKTGFKDILESHLELMSNLGNTFGLMFMALLASREMLERYEVIPKRIGVHALHQMTDQYRDINYISDFLNVLTVCIILIFTLVPETLILCVIICLSEYSSLHRF